jgi:RNA polymerase sigma-70 factor (ECF subfamily)
VGVLTTESADADSSLTTTQPDDATLIARIRAGDDTALGILLDRYSPLVINIGCRILRDRWEAQELVQDAFLHVYRKCHLFDRNKGTFRSWLIQIASHRAFDRREYLNIHRIYDGRNLEEILDLVPSNCNVEYQAQIRQNEAALRKVFLELNSKQRITLELYFFEGYTLREISQQMNESLANVRHYYYRALERLRSSVQGTVRKGD